MHHTKTAARREAWRDEKNPFCKFKPARKPSDIEGGRTQPNDLTKTATDDPEEYNLAHDRRSNMKSNARSPYSQTAPGASSTRRDQEIGDDVQFMSVVSPSSTTTESPTNGNGKAREITNEKTGDNVANGYAVSGANTNEGPAPKKRGFAKFFGGKSQHRKEEMDNSKKKPKHKFSVMSQIRATLFNSWINILLIASPVGIAIHYAGVLPVAVFVVNFIAIVPLAALLSYATEEIALRVGEVLGGLLNASFGNAVELIVSIIALLKKQTLIVQTSLIGSMLSNLLLVMGMCFFAGGYNRIKQEFNVTVAQTAASLLFLAVSSLIIPTAFDEWANTGSTDKTNSGAPAVPGVASVSRATAIMLLFVYACYLFFQLKSHSAIYNASGDKNKPRQDMQNKSLRVKSIMPGKNRKARKDREAQKAEDDALSGSSTTARDEEHDEVLPQREREGSTKDEEEPEEPQLAVWVAVGLLAASTVLVALNAECLVDSINAITCGGGISKNFVGLILLPIVGNAAEHATAVTVAIKDKMDLAIGVAVGSSMQIALLVLPFMVVLGWIIGDDSMTLYFDGFQIAVLFVSVLLVNYLIQDGESHWLEGILLMTLYIIIAVAAWYYPTAPGLSDCPA